MSQPLPPLITPAFVRRARPRAASPFLRPRVPPARLGPRPFAKLLALALLVFAGFCARAHEPGESTLVLSADAEALEALASLSLPSAAALLPADTRPPLSASTFAQHRPALLAAAGRVCALLDADEATLAPERVLVSLHDAHEIRFHFFYPPAARPARLRVPLLSRLPAGFFFEVADKRAAPARRAVLTAASPALPLPGP